MKGFPDLPPIWLLGTMVVCWLLGRVSFVSLGQIGNVVGAVLILAALALIAWSVLWFWRKRTPIEPHHVPKALIVEGPYRVTRNPIYLALVVISFGFALRQESILALVPVPVLFFVLDRRFIAPEEAMLRAAFGKAADGYLAATRRWI